MLLPPDCTAVSNEVSLTLLLTSILQLFLLSFQEPRPRLCSVITLPHLFTTSGGDIGSALPQAEQGRLYSQPHVYSLNSSSPKLPPCFWNAAWSSWAKPSVNFLGPYSSWSFWSTSKLKLFLFPNFSPYHCSHRESFSPFLPHEAGCLQFPPQFTAGSPAHCRPHPATHASPSQSVLEAPSSEHDTPSSLLCCLLLKWSLPGLPLSKEKFYFTFLILEQRL